MLAFLKPVEFPRRFMFSSSWLPCTAEYQMNSIPPIGALCVVWRTGWPPWPQLPRRCTTRAQPPLGLKADISCAWLVSVSAGLSSKAVTVEPLPSIPKPSSTVIGGMVGRVICMRSPTWEALPVTALVAIPTANAPSCEGRRDPPLGAFERSGIE